MRVIVRGVKLYRSKGRTYCYHRATGKRIVATPGSPEFFAEIEALSKATVTPTAKPGTLGMILKRYQASDAFGRLAPRTQSDYRKVIDYLKPLDAMPVGEINPPFARGLRERTQTARGYRFANYVTSVLSAALTWAAEHGHIDENPIKGHVKKAKRPRGMPRRNRPWSTEERDAVMDAAPFHVRVPFALMRWAGLRTDDALTMPRSAFDGAAIQVRTQKTGQLVWMPCPAPLRSLLSAVPKHDATTLAVNSRGRPWTGNGFRSVLGKLLDKLEAKGLVGPGLSPHGLRHSFAIDLRELGYDERTIADALGQAELATARHYAQGADLKKKMTAVVRRLDRLDTKRKSSMKSKGG